jgi:hypothetical protein
MKKILSLTAIVALGIGLLTFGCTSKVNAKDSGEQITSLNVSSKTITKEVSLAKYDKIEADGPVKICFTQSENRSAKVTGSSQTMPYLRTSVSGSKLKIYFTQEYYDKFKNSKSSDVTLYLSAPTLKDVSLGLTAEFEAATLYVNGDLNIDAATSSEVEIKSLKASKLKLVGSTAAEFEVKNLVVKKLIIDGSTASDIEVSGQADSAELSASTAAEVRVATLTANSVKCTASSNGNIKISDGVAKSATLDASIGGKINAKKLRVTNVTASKSLGGSVSYWKGANVVTN